jgi:phosphoribosyl-AMP cyclohydrolase
MVKDGLNKAIQYFSMDCDDPAIKGITLSKTEAIQMFAVALIRQAVRDVVSDKKFRVDAELWLQGEKSTHILHMIGVDYNGRDILKMATIQRERILNERN